MNKENIDCKASVLSCLRTKPKFIEFEAFMRVNDKSSDNEYMHVINDFFEHGGLDCWDDVRAYINELFFKSELYSNEKTAELIEGDFKRSKAALKKLVSMSHVAPTLISDITKIKTEIYSVMDRQADPDLVYLVFSILFNDRSNFEDEDGDDDDIFVSVINSILEGDCLEFCDLALKGEGFEPLIFESYKKYLKMKGF